MPIQALIGVKYMMRWLIDTLSKNQPTLIFILLSTVAVRFLVLGHNENRSKDESKKELTDLQEQNMQLQAQLEKLENSYNDLNDKVEAIELVSQEKNWGEFYHYVNEYDKKNITPQNVLEITGKNVIKKSVEKAIMEKKLDVLEDVLKEDADVYPIDSYERWLVIIKTILDKNYFNQIDKKMFDPLFKNGVKFVITLIAEGTSMVIDEGMLLQYIERIYNSKSYAFSSISTKQPDQPEKQPEQELSPYKAGRRIELCH